MSDFHYNEALYPVSPFQAPCHCDCCGQLLFIHWTEVRGVGTCQTCHCPHIVQLRGPDGEVIGKYPEAALTPEGLDFARALWKEQNRTVFPNLYTAKGWKKLRIQVRTDNWQLGACQLNYASEVAKNQGKIPPPIKN